VYVRFRASESCTLERIISGFAVLDRISVVLGSVQADGPLVKTRIKDDWLDSRIATLHRRRVLGALGTKTWYENWNSPIVSGQPSMTAFCFARSSLSLPGLIWWPALIVCRKQSLRR
jgi:hypothetical protein